MKGNETAQAPYDAIFFDMDGTLLPIEVRDFLMPYYTLLYNAALREGYDPEAFRENLDKGIWGMMDHPQGETNEQAFWRIFFSGLYPEGGPDEQTSAQVRGFFERFYAEDFDKAGAGVVPNPAAQRVLETLSEKGYPLYLTTMPLFPYDAIAWRMKWAACDIGLFSRVTTFDNSCFSKPDPAYFTENVELAGVPASRVLVVGNNTLDDLCCLKAGCDAYLVTDYLINENNFDLDTVKHGSLAEFAQWADSLPDCTSTTALDWQSRADKMRLG